MKRNIFGRYIMGILFCMMAILGMKVSVRADNQTDAIRIGYIHYEGFFAQEEDGTFSGYGVDYLNEI